MEKAASLELIAEGVWIWHAYDESVRTELFSTAIMADDGLVVMDPIDLAPGAMARLGALGPVAAIVLTNGNHSRAATRFRSRFGAPVLAHPDALGELTSTVDGSLHVGRRVGGSLELIELPGAGLGEVALLHENRSLHLGDALVNLDSTGLAVLPDKYCSNHAQLAQSLRQLRSRRVESVTFAHGQPLVVDADTRLQDFLENLTP